MSGKVLAETGVFLRAAPAGETRARVCGPVEEPRGIEHVRVRQRADAHAAWRSKPSWAVIATEDKAFDQAMLIHMAERINARITKVSASHALFMTQPKVVADTIDRAAREAGQTAK